MSEEQMDANTATEETQSSEDSSASENTEALTQEKPNPDAQGGPAKEEKTPFHEHPRFQELISEKNELRDKLSQMERILQEKLEGPKQTPVDVAKQKLLSLGVEEKAANEVIEAIKMVSGNQVENRVAPVEQAAVQREIDSWLSDFSKAHDDYEKLEPQMYNVFKALPEQTQRTIASDPKGVELLYSHVKMQNMQEELNRARQEGANGAYKNKQNKSSMSPTPGGSKNPPGSYSRKSIDAMSPAEYKKAQKDILKAMNEGKITEE